LQPYGVIDIFKKVMEVNFKKKDLPYRRFSA